MVSTRTSDRGKGLGPVRSDVLQVREGPVHVNSDDTTAVGLRTHGQADVLARAKFLDREPAGLPVLPDGALACRGFRAVRAPGVVLRGTRTRPVRPWRT